MEHVVVERSFQEPVTYEELQCREGRSRWCFDMHQVEFLYSYFSKDRRRMMCVYRAPDAEAVRVANEKAGLPFDRVWTASVHRADEEPG